MTRALPARLQRAHRGAKARTLCAIRPRRCLYETGADTNLCMRSAGDFGRAGPREFQSSSLRGHRHDRARRTRHAYVARGGADRMPGSNRRTECMASHRRTQRAHRDGPDRPGSSVVPLYQADVERRADRAARFRDARGPGDPVGRAVRGHLRMQRGEPRCAIDPAGVRRHRRAAAPARRAHRGSVANLARRGHRHADAR